MERIQSFKSFSQVKTQLREEALQNEIAAKRETSASAFSELLKKYNVSNASEVSEDQLETFMLDLVGLKADQKANEAKSDRDNVIAAWDKTGVTDLNTIAKIYSEAMTDANFHKETSTSKAIGSASRAGKVGDMGQEIASAAKWNGIAIANGTVDFLKNIDQESAAEKLLSAITKFDLNESVVLNSLEQIIEEGTRGFFGKIDKKGNISAVYTHYDSYPENMLPIIKKAYKKVEDVDAVIAKGDNSGLEADINKIKFYNDKRAALTGNAKDTDKFLRNAAGEGGAEFVYLYDERDNKWYMSDIYKTRELVPAFESVEVAEAADDFAGWIAFFNGKRVEIKKDEAKDLWSAKKLAIAKMKVPKSKESMVAIAPAVEEMFVAEAEINIVPEIEGEFWQIYSKLNDLAEETTDSKWRKAIESIIKGLEGVENKVNDFSRKLGVVPTHEGRAFAAAAKKAKDEGKEEFEFNGKKYPVLIKEEDIKEGNAFGAARAEAIAKGEKTFKVGDEEYDVESVDAEDKENAEEFANEDLGSINVANKEADTTKGEDRKIIDGEVVDEEPKEVVLEPLTEGEKEEQAAMELYVKLVDLKKGKYTEKEMQTMSKNDMEDVVDAEGLKGSEAKKMVDELLKIAKG